MMLDALFFTVTLSIIAYVAFGSRWSSRRAYCWSLLACVLLSVLIIIGFNEYEVEIQGNSPIHAGLLALCQYGALTLSAKVWFSIIYPGLQKFQKVALNLFMLGGLAGLVITSYRLKEGAPILLILLYPLASVALALIAETIEVSLEKKND